MTDQTDQGWERETEFQDSGTGGWRKPHTTGRMGINLGAI